MSPGLKVIICKVFRLVLVHSKMYVVVRFYKKIL